jgi:hypothetical protein
MTSTSRHAASSGNTDRRAPVPAQPRARCA